MYIITWSSCDVYISLVPYIWNILSNIDRYFIFKVHYLFIANVTL